jgi:Xaa-Pro dipeptidase
MQYYPEHIQFKKALYQRALQEAQLDAVVIAAGTTQYCFRDDIHVPFAVSPYFKEFLPLLQHPDCFLLLGDADKPKLLLKVVADYWHSAPEALPGWIAEQFDVVEYSTDSELAQQWQGLPARTAFIVEQSAPFAAESAEVVLTWMDYHRAWKTEYERLCLREANRLAVRGHRAAEQAFLADLSEIEIHHAYLRAVGCTEADLPYDSIVALNEHAAVLHHTMLGRERLPVSRSFLLDGGAQFHGYASDITRTFRKDDADAHYVALLAGVEALEQELVGELSTGMSYTQLHLSAHRKVAALLHSIGLITVSAEEAVERNLTAAFFPHGIGHLLGLQVHDRGGHMSAADGTMSPPPEGHPFLRCTRDISAGMVFTVEPGIYMIPMLLAPYREANDAAINWQLVDLLRPYGGVRIEDDVIVHADSVENLTRDAFAIS